MDELLPQNHAQLLHMHPGLSFQVLGQHSALEVELLQPVLQMHYTLKTRAREQLASHRLHADIQHRLRCCSLHNKRPKPGFEFACFDVHVWLVAVTCIKNAWMKLCILSGRSQHVFFIHISIVFLCRRATQTRMTVVHRRIMLLRLLAAPLIKSSSKTLDQSEEPRGGASFCLQ